MSTGDYGTYRIIEQRKLSQACASLQKRYDIDSDTREYDDTCTNRDMLCPHAFLYFYISL